MQIKNKQVQIPRWRIFFLLFYFGTGTVHELMCQPLDETEGAQPRIRLMGLFIELSGLHGRRREMCQRERERRKKMF